VTSFRSEATNGTNLLKPGRKSQSNVPIATVLAFLIPILVVLPLGALFICTCMRKKHRERMAELQKLQLGALDGNGMHNPLQMLRTHTVGDSTLRELQNEMTSGSGSGHTHLVRRTLAMEIDFRGTVGKGR